MYFEGNSHTANFVPMINSIKFNDSFYYEHKANLLDKINTEKINSLTNFYDEIIYATHISDIDDLKIFQNITKKLNENIKILILGPIPNVTKKIDPLKCFIKSIDCSYQTSVDINKRKLIEYYLVVNKIIKEHNNIFFYNPYKIICPNKECYVYDVKNDILTHRDESHLTIEGSLLLKEDFENFYNMNFKG